MKKRALRKDFYMEIRKTWNRFLSIFLIVAMGAAFYSGIQAAAPDMRKTGDAYFDRKQLADAKVIGTMGMTQEDVLALSQTEGVSVAEPGYMTDVLCGDEKSKQVLHVESLLPTINQVTVTEGALPEKENECLMDEEFAKANGYQVGDSLAIREEVEAACKKAALDGFIHSLPKGYDTPVGELGGALSGGERQRIGVARAFLHDAPFLLLDEPTSNLDSLNEGVILKAVRAECKDKTVLLVSHRKSTMAAADISFSVESGRLS